MAEQNSLMYLLGQPGSGKTTLMRATMAGVATEVLAEPFAMLRYPGGYELGGIREGFGGSDVLPMNVQPRALQWLREVQPAAVLVEGDRLANDKFFVNVLLAGYDLSVVWLRCSDACAGQRRRARGSKQNPAWVAGRASKVLRLAESWCADAWVLDAEMPLADLVLKLRSHPVVRVARGE